MPLKCHSLPRNASRLAHRLLALKRGNALLFLGWAREFPGNAHVFSEQSTSVRDDQVFETTYRTSKHPHSLFPKCVHKLGSPRFVLEAVS